MEPATPPAKDDDLLSIGRFGRLVGLSVGALRHYDELDLLRPARTDPETGYRSYRRDQLETARIIVRLRDLEVPLETIRAFLGTDDPAERRRLMDEHRRRIEARTFRLQGVLHVVGQLAGATDLTVTETSTMTTQTLDSITDIDPATHRRIGVALFNHTWTLLEKPDRTPAEIDEMIHAAHASRFHWERAEGRRTVNLARGEWQCSRVYAVLGRGEPAVWHAKRCLTYVDAAGEDVDAWDAAAAYEALSRAYAVAGDRAAATDWKARAVVATAAIADKDEREIIENDIATLPV